MKTLLRDTSILLGRSMRHITRSPDTIITVAIMPIAFMLLFVYVFGGAIDAGTDNYVNYLLPGILLIAIASGISYTAVRLFTRHAEGIFERFHSMPVARSSVLWGHVLTSLVSNAISLAIIMLVALLMGFRSSAGILAWLAVVGILALFTLALTWLAVIPGLTAKTMDGAAAFSYPLIFLPFISSAFVPTDTMPTPVRAFAENQPVTAIVDRAPQPFRPAAAGGGAVERRGLVPGHPRGCLRAGHGHLPSQVRLNGRATRASSWTDRQDVPKFPLARAAHRSDLRSSGGSDPEDLGAPLGASPSRCVNGAWTFSTPEVVDFCSSSVTTSTRGRVVTSANSRTTRSTTRTDATAARWSVIGWCTGQWTVRVV